MSEAPLATIQKIRHQITDALSNLEILEINLKPTSTTVPTQQPTLTPPTPPTLNLENLPWKSFPSGNGAWIFSNLEETPAKELVAKLTGAKGKLDLGEYTYKFSGEKDMFISRFHKKEK